MVTSNSLALSLKSSSSSSSSDVVWCYSTVDFTAAEEFILAHYGKSNYFSLLPQDNNNNKILYSSKNNGKKEQNNHIKQNHLMPFYNARCIDSTTKKISFPEQGFTLTKLQPIIKNPSDHNTINIDWNNLDSIRQQYLPQVQDAIYNAYGGPDVVSDIIFWCPTLRIRNAKQTTRHTNQNDNKSSSSDNNIIPTSTTTPQASYVSTAHIDTDVNAYESIQQFVSLIVKNRFPGTEVVDQEYLINALQQNNCRFAIVNAWRNIGTEPIQQYPLAFCLSKYKEGNNIAFPYGTHDNENSIWYTYPDMTNNELLLFCQYDRDITYPSDLWHCAISIDKKATTTTTNYDIHQCHRESFDVRCFVLFHESVSLHRDRWMKKQPSILNYKQSQEFCSDQAERRKLNLIIAKEKEKEEE